MAVSHIAGARSAGKSAFDRAEILGAAHAGARSKIANNRAWRSYPEAFAVSLKQAWQTAKQEARDRRMAAEDAAEAALAAANPLPNDVARRISDLRMIAEAQTLTAYGSHRRELILAEAEDIERAARCMMIPAQDISHYAH